MPKVSE
jgi:hypothetical protein